jgi:hypothetical protein
MAVKIRAVRNNLGTGSLPWHAQASWSRLVDTEAFVNRMAAGRTTVTRTEILAVFQLAREELCALLAEGCYVKTPFGAALPVAKGSFKDMHEAFRPDSRESGHSLRFDFRLDPDLEDDALSRVECRRVSAEDRVSPVIRSVECMSGKVERVRSASSTCAARVSVSIRPMAPAVFSCEPEAAGNGGSMPILISDRPGSWLCSRRAGLRAIVASSYARASAAPRSGRPKARPS